MIKEDFLQVIAEILFLLINGERVYSFFDFTKKVCPMNQKRSAGIAMTLPIRPSAGGES